MKRILFVASDMEIGGAERALLGLLNSIDTNLYAVDLFLLRHRGPFMKLIPPHINLLPENKYYSDLGVPINEVIRKKHFSMVAARTIGKWKAKRFIARNKISGANSLEIHYSFRFTRTILPTISEKDYDLAIGFTIPYYIVAEKVKAKHTAVWLHTDYSKLAGDTDEELKVWSAYEYIVSISYDVTKAFLSKFPSLENRIVEIENIVSPELIAQQAKAEDVHTEMPHEQGVVRLLSVGRFTSAKNFDNVPDICKRILNNGFAIKWYIIGFGGDESLIKRKIIESGMQNNVILLGKKDNPYPYIAECDMYIQPSRFEGKAVTVREAQILNKPVIITNYPTAKSQLRDGVDGIIVPLDNERCAKGICDVLSNKKIIIRLIENTKKQNYGNSNEAVKLYNMID